MKRIVVRIWDLVRSWLTVPVLFVLVNIVIGTIVVTSARRRSKNCNTSTGPSMLTRLMSGNFSRKFSFDGDLPWSSLRRQDSIAPKPLDEAEPREEGKPQEDGQEVSDPDERPLPAPGIEPPTLTGTAGLSPRLAKCKSDSPTTTSGELLPPSPPSPGVKKSGSFDSIFSEVKGTPPDLGVPRSRKPVKAEDGSATTEVDAKAEDFIQRFKRQLKLQRIDSIMRYNEMVDRGK